MRGAREVEHDSRARAFQFLPNRRPVEDIDGGPLDRNIRGANRKPSPGPSAAPAPGDNSSRLARGKVVKKMGTGKA